MRIQHQPHRNIGRDFTNGLHGQSMGQIGVMQRMKGRIHAAFARRMNAVEMT